MRVAENREALAAAGRPKCAHEPTDKEYLMPKEVLSNSAPDDGPEARHQIFGRDGNRHRADLPHRMDLPVLRFPT
jgi:hypothetical protein